MLTLENGLNPQLPTRAALSKEFLTASPFKHISIDGFLREEIAEGLLREFPVFNEKRAVNEHGHVSGKATLEQIRSHSSFYKSFDTFISSKPFLDYISEITGIPDLIYDPNYYGGGTHDNKHGQELDPHIDFNYDSTTGYHRRLNLIIYLNKEWRDEWGGQLEIHSNPRRPEQNQIRAFTPLFNRCIIFETNEHSWHGFPRIKLPPDKRDLSRKSFTVYYYTRSRPEDEIAPPHSTFYVQRPLPPHLTRGHTLSSEDIDEIRGLLRKRDDWIEYYQNKELEFSRTQASMHSYVKEMESRIRIPLQGYVQQIGGTSDFFADNWLGPNFRAVFRPALDITGLHLKLRVPEFFPAFHISLDLNGTQAGEWEIAPGRPLDLQLAMAMPKGRDFSFTLKSATSVNCKQKGISDDARDLSALLEQFIFMHQES